MDLKTAFSTLLVLGILGTSLAAPARGRCANECKTAVNPKFNYAQGKVYHYTYVSETGLNVVGAIKETPGFKIKANAEFHAVSACEIVLKLTNVQLTGTFPVPNVGDFKKALEDKTLVFSHSDGRIDNVCPDAADPAWVVNFKRAVVSTFQNSMDNHLETHTREVDVIGQCNTHYTLDGDKITKTKDVLSCTNRVGNISAIQADHYPSYSDIQSLPLLDSEYVCSHTIADSITTHVSCHEVHRYRPYSKGEKAATTETTVKLDYTKNAKSSIKTPQTVTRSNLLFDHDDENSIKPDVQDTNKALTKLCQNYDKVEIGDDAATQFTRLVYLVRRLSSEQLNTILQSLPKLCPANSQKLKDTYISSLAGAGTENAAYVLFDITKSSEISAARIRLWSLSFAFIKKPSQKFIDLLANFLTTTKFDTAVELSSSSIVHAYCRHHPDCHDLPSIKKVIDFFGARVQGKCVTTTEDEEDKIISALKSFGNLGHVEQHASNIVECVKNPAVKVPIRLAAVQAFRRITVSDDDITEALQNGKKLYAVLSDVTQDTEVRIAVYLLFSKYPSSRFYKHLTELLEHEVVNQVTSFIYTHIQNLKHSTSPLKREIHELAQNVQLESKFHRDIRKFSRNYDFSRFCDDHNFGADFESNIIFSPDSFLPRSASFNFTVDLFGSAINLFELELRTEHFEYLLEKYFGPTGKVTTSDRHELRKQFTDKWRKISEGIESSAGTEPHRHKRELPYKASKLRELQDKAGFKPSREPEGSVSLKVFGNELIYRHFHHLNEVYDKTNPFHIKEILNKLATHKEFDVTRNWMFLDATYSIPTASGIPLRLDINATVSLGLKLKSHFDIRQFLLRPRSADIKSFIQPSANLETAATLYLDAHVGKTGIKFNSNLYSAGAIDGTFQLKEGESLVANLDFPTPSQTLVELKTNSYVVQNDLETPTTPVNPNRYEIHGCTPGKSGFQLCSDVSLPKPLIDGSRPFIPMGGPIKYNLILKKKDAGLQGVHFTAVWKREKGEGDEVKNTVLKLSLDTPGSATPREYTLDYQLNRVDHLLRLNLRSPKLKFGVNGNYVNEETKKEANLKVNINDEREYSISGKAKVSTQGNTRTYNGEWEIATPNAPATKITGKIIRTIGKKIEFDIKSDASSPKPVVLKGFVQRDGPLGYGQNFVASCDLQVVLPVIETKIVGNIENHNEEFENKHKINLNVDYSLKSDGEKRNFAIKTDCETKFDREAHEFKLKRDVEFKSSKYPHCNVQSKLLIEKIHQEYHSLLDAKWGDNFGDVNKKLFYEHQHKYKAGSRGAYEGHGTITLIYPKRQISWNIDSKINYQPHKALDYDLALKYAQDKTIKLSVEYKNLTTKLDSYQGEIKLELPNRELILRDKVTEKGNGEYVGETYIQWQKDQYITINSSYKNKGADGVIHHEAEATVLYGTKPEPIRKYKLILHGEMWRKYSISARVDRPDVSYTVDAIYDHPTPNSANFNLNLKVPWIEGQVTSKRVPGDFQGKVDLKTYTGRKVVGSAGLKGDSLNKVLTAELKWDAGRDESKKFSVKADIERPRKKAANIKGTLSVPNLTLKGTVNYELPAIIFNGPHHVFADIEYAPNKKFTVDADVNIDRSSSGRRQSHGEVVYSSHEIKNWKLTYDTNFHNHPDERTFNAHFDVECPKHGHFGGELDYLRGHRKFSTSVEARYGEGKTVRLGGGAFLDFGGHGHGYDIGGKFELKTPFPGFQDFAITARDAFHHEHENGHFVTDHHVRWAPGKEVGLTVEYNRIHKHGESFELTGKIEVDTPFEKYHHQKLDVDINFDRHPRAQLHSNIGAEWGDGKKVDTHLHYVRDGPKVDTSLVIDGRKYKEGYYLNTQFSNEVSGPESFHTSATVQDAHGKIATLDGQITHNDDKRTVDVTISAPATTFKTIAFKGQVLRNGNKRTGDLTGTWGPGKTVELKAELTLDGAGSFDGKVIVNSVDLNLKDVSVGVKRKLAAANREYGLHMDFGEDRDIELGLEVKDKADRTGITGTGTVKINGEDFITSNIDVLDSATTKNRYGRLLQYSVEITNPSFSFSSVLVLLSEKGLNPTFKICSLEGENCIKLEALIDISRNDPYSAEQKKDHTVYAKFSVQDGPGKSRTAGVIARIYKERNNKEVSFKLILDEEHSKFLGLSYKKTAKDDANKPDTKKSYQIILPSRTIEARSDKIYSSQGYVYSLHLLADAIKEPNKEVLLTSDVKKSSDAKGLTRVTKISIKHPKFTKDLIILSNLNKPSSGKLVFKQQIDFDLSKDPKKKFSVEIEVLDDPKFSNGHNYSVAFALRQPALKNLDFKIKGHIGRSRESRTAGLELNWLTRDGRNYVLSFLNDIDKVQRTIHGYIHTPVRHISWDGDYQKFEDGGIPSYRSNLDLLYNNKIVRSASIEYSRGPEYNIKYFVNPEDKTRLLRVHGGVIDDTTYEWTVTRVRAGQQIEDLDFYHHLNNSHLLFNRYKWRPELLTELRDAIDSRLDSATDVLSDIAGTFFSKAGAEVVDKTSGIRDIIRTDLAPYFASLKEKIVTIGTELKTNWQPLKLTKLRAVLESIFGAFLDAEELVNRLEAAIEKSHVSISNVVTKLGDVIGNLGKYNDHLSDVLSQLAEKLPEKIQALRTAIRAKLPEIVEKIRNLLIRVRDIVNSFVENQYLSKALEKFRAVWDATFGRVRGWISTLLETIFGSGDGKTGLYDRVKAKLYEYAEGDGEAQKALKGILLAIKSVKEKVKEIFGDICQAYADYRANVIQRWTAIYDSLDPDLKELIAEIRTARQALFAQLYDGRGIKDRIREFTDHAIGAAKERIKQFTSTAIFDPKNGLIQFYLPLILPVDSIRTLRHEGFSLRRWLDEDDVDVEAMIKRVKRAIKSGDVLPPFEAHAMLIGDQHYVTYDHRFYDFVGKCQYVLTTDLVDQNFSVIVNYVDKQGKPEKSSIVVISDSHNIEIKSDYKVLLDDQEVELPNQIENTHIHRELHAIKVSNNKGFTVVYDLAHNLVLVNVSGWYFGRLGGLFGNYNYEPSDDFHTPDGLNLTNPTLFANSWEVSNRCVSKDNYASHQTALFGSEGYLWCHKLFSSDFSPLQKCFPYAPAGNYLQACLEEVAVRKGQLEPADTACRLAAAYVDACHHHNVRLHLPSKCLRCSLPNGEKYGYGDVQTLKGTEVPKSADVVFILEQKECNRRILLESLDEIAKDLDKEFTAQGLTNNQYGIVAFGGEGVQGHAHPHTARGQLFTDARSVVLALKNMGFSGTQPTDAFEAVHLALDYPFRTGVAKTAILVLCDRCHAESQSVDQYELRYHMLRNGISLHVLSPEEATVKSKPQAAQQIIGFDAHTTYKAKDSTQKTLTGDVELRPHVDNVDDVCQQLAQELDGSVFRSDQMGVKKQNVGKSVKTVFSRRVVASAKPPACQNCNCVAGPDGVPQPACSLCTPLKPKTVLGHHDDDDHAATPAPPKDRRVRPQPPGRRT